MKKSFVLNAVAVAIAIAAAALVFTACGGKDPGKIAAQIEKLDAQTQEAEDSGDTAKAAKLSAERQKLETELEKAQTEAAAKPSGKANPATDFKYALNKDGTGVEIQEYIGVKGGKVVIPAEIEGYPVVEIDGFGEYSEPFNKTSGRTERITSVGIPDTVTTIGNGAFSNCEGLKSVTLPKGLKTLKDVSFGGSGLTAVTIPEGTTKIGGYAFEDCKKLVSVTLPESLEEIGIKAFKGCSELAEVKLPSHALKYEQNFSFTTNDAFKDCPKLSLATRKAITDSGYKDGF